VGILVLVVLLLMLMALHSCHNINSWRLINIIDNKRNLIVRVYSNYNIEWVRLTIEFRMFKFLKINILIHK